MCSLIHSANASRAFMRARLDVVLELSSSQDALPTRRWGGRGQKTELGSEAQW